MHVPIQHIIGTIALIALVICSGLAYSIITTFAETDIYHQQLQQVSDILALNIVEVANLANFTSLEFTSNNTMVKAIDLPLDIGDKAYAVEIVNGVGQDPYNVKAYLISQTNTQATSLMPFNCSQCTLETTPKTFIVNNGQATVTSLPVIYGGSNNTVVWAWKGSGNLTVGIGRITLSG